MKLSSFIAPKPFCALALLLTLVLNNLAAHAVVPTIINNSPTAYAGDVISLEGDSFGAKPLAQYSNNGTTWATLPVLSFGTYQGASSITAQIPINIAQTGVLQVRVSNGTAWSLPVSINKPRAMHYDTPEIAAGSQFRIYGRNLMYPGAPTPKVTLIDRTAPHLSKTVTASLIGAVTNSTAYVLNVTAPSTIVPGDIYDVYVNNGLFSSGVGTQADQPLKGRAGGGDPWSLRVPWGSDFVVPSPISSSPYNVLNYGADNTGTYNAQSQIQAAIDAATANKGGVVYLPAGTYLLQGPNTQFQLQLHSNVVLAGASTATTILQYGFGTPPTQGGYQGYAISFGNGWNPISNCGIADMTIQNVDTSGLWDQNLSLQSSPAANPGLTSEELFLQRVYMKTNCGNSLPISNVDKIAIENSTFDQLGVSQSYTNLLGTMSNFVCRGNTVNWSGGQALGLGGVTNGVIENNTYTRNCDPQYPSIINTRAFDNSFLTNVAIVHNTFAISNGPRHDQNDGETISSEGYYRPDASMGIVTAATSTSVTDTNNDFTKIPIYINNVITGYTPINTTQFGPNAVVMIVSGPGTGQWSKVISNTATTLTLATPWLVMPTAASHYATFQWNTTNETVAYNTLSGGRAGISYYLEPVRDVLVDGNALTNTGGIQFGPYQDITSGLFTPEINMQITNNVDSETDHISPVQIGVLDFQTDPNAQFPHDNFGILALGVEVRGNVINGGGSAYTSSLNSASQYSPLMGEGYGAFQFGYSYLANDDGTPAILDMIFQNDTANNIDSANYTSTDHQFSLGGTLTEAAYTLSSGDYQTVIYNPVSSNSYNLLFDNFLPYLNYAAGVTHHASVNTALGNIWVDGDIGYPGITGNASTLSSSGSSKDLFTVNGGGDIWGTSDNFNFCTQMLTGNGTIMARVTNLNSTDPWAKAGVMIRSDVVNPGAIFAATDLETNGISGGFYRSTTSTTSNPVATQADAPAITTTLPYWVKLVRAGNLFTSSLAPDNNGVPGSTWTVSGTPQTIAMSPTAYAGLSVSGESIGDLCTFDNVSVTSTWADTDIGSPALAGSVSGDPNGSKFTVIGGGGDIWGAAGVNDQFNFYNQPLTGDGTITACVTSTGNSGDWSKTGVMIRASLSPTSTFVDTIIEANGASGGITA